MVLNNTVSVLVLAKEYVSGFEKSYHFVLFIKCY